jgi:hypothetical protein
MKKRGTYDRTRLHAVLAYLQEPRTRSEVLEHFGDRKALFACWNLAKSGDVVNVTGIDGRTRWRALVKPGKETRKTRLRGSAALGADLCRAWGINTQGATA